MNKTYAVTITLNTGAPISRSVLGLLGQIGHSVYVINRPLAPEGLGRTELKAWYEGLPTDEQHAVTNEVRAYVARLTEFDAEALQQRNEYEHIEVVGGDFQYTHDASTYETSHDLLWGLGFVKCGIDQWIDQNCLLDSSDEFGLNGPVTAVVSTSEATDELLEAGEVGKEFKDDEQQWPPMWNVVWELPWINGGVQELADFTGFTVFEDDRRSGYVLGVQGAGYDFYEAHWLPLVYFQGALSN